MPVSPKQALRSNLKDKFVPTEVGLFPEIGERYINPAVEAITQNPVSQFVSSLVQPVDPQTGLPNVDVAGPVLTGITAKANAEKILKELQSRIKTWQAMKMNVSLPEVEATFTRLKYPELAGRKLREWSTEYGIADQPSTGGTLGQFFPYQKKAVIYPNIKRIDPSTGSAAETGMHEITHALQWNRQKRLQELVGEGEVVLDPITKMPIIDPVTNRPMLGTYKSGNVTPTEIAEIQNKIKEEFKDVVFQNPQQKAEFFNRESTKRIRNRELTKLQEYQTQPVETEARQGGATGKRAWEKFVDLVLPKLPEKVLTTEDVITKPRFTRTYQDMIYEQYRREISSARTKQQEKEATANLKWRLNEVANSIARGLVNPTRVEDLMLSPDVIKDIARQKQYTKIFNPSMKSEEMRHQSLNTIEDLLGLPSVVR